MKLTLRSPFLWISATALSGLLYFFAFHFFPQTFPLIHLKISMDLEQALDKADELAHQHLFGPNEYEYAAMFNTDTTVKTFVELEAGGKDAFIAMMENNLYMPYTWRVRHFKEHEKNETTIVFTPDGQPYGFVETVSENIPGSQLSSTEAQQIAEKNGAADWNINFADYTLVEASQKTEPSERIDHTFVYERTDKKISLPAEALAKAGGEGLYRLKIVISGNKMTEVTHFVKVPESFNRRYAEMRSANNTISWAATLAMWLLYILCGCGFGLFWIIRQRWQIIKQPLQWAIVLASLSTLTAINKLPFLWMQYNSAHSSNGFLIQLFLSFFINLLAQLAFLTVVIMTAESLTRRAFGNQPQLWSLWNNNISTSYAVLGRTVGGYLLVGFNCAFVIGFYLFSSRYLGWWSPSEMLFDPNILATYVPWFSPIAQSLNAGFMEECLFRAVPLAGAALIGDYFGKRNWWIGAAFILQAIVFGAAHANYPMQPSYARLVELLIPSFIWGAIYLRFGLFTNIIAHTVYDIIWFSLPIFVSQAPHALAYKITIILIALMPLMYVIYARILKGHWSTLPQSALNKSWTCSAIAEKQIEPECKQTISHTLSTTTQRLVFGLGIAGLLAWIGLTPFTHDGVTITVTKDKATTIANTFLENKNITLNAPWKTLPLVFTHYNLVPQIAMQHKFIWQEGNKELYHNLLGTYLHPAHWTIRYAQFDTDIVQRAEEHKVMFYNNSIWRYYHQLPESAVGAQLSHHEARAIAHQTLQEQFNLNPAELTEISATPTQLPNRRNWLFIFSNPAVYPLQNGQARITITIAGDKVVDAVRTIHVPEEWERNELHKQNMLNIIAIIFFLILLFLFIFAIVLAFRQKMVFDLSKPLFFILCGIAVVLFFVDIINTWPSIAGGFNTSLPLMNQLLQFITSLTVSAVLKSIVYAALISYIITHKRSHQLPNNATTTYMGICMGLFFAGIVSIAHKLLPTNMPLWPNYDALGCTIPWITTLIHTLTHYAQITIVFSLLCILIDTATHKWQKHCLFFTGFAALCGIALFALPSLEDLPLWIIVGAIIGWIFLAMYRFVIRYDYALIPLATGSFAVLQLVQKVMFNAYPGAMAASIISVCAISFTAALWYSSARRNPSTSSGRAR